MGLMFRSRWTSARDRERARGVRRDGVCLRGQPYSFVHHPLRQSLIEWTRFVERDAIGPVVGREDRDTRGETR
jgi:hypothetical protein